MHIRTAADLGLAIRERRRKLGLDQRALAEKVGVSRQWIVAVEKGKPRAEVRLILRTLHILELSIRLDAGRPARRPTPQPLVDIDAVVAYARERER